jgi:hypothetical protein
MGGTPFKPGAVVVVRVCEKHMCEYRLARVDALGVDGKHIYTREHGAFRVDGKKCMDNTGQVRLLLPIGDVLKAALNGEIWRDGTKLLQTRELTQEERDIVNELRTANMSGEK